MTEKFTGFTDDLDEQYNNWAAKQSEFPDKSELKVLRVAMALGFYPDCDSWADYFSNIYYQDGKVQGLGDMGIKMVDED